MLPHGICPVDVSTERNQKMKVYVTDRDLEKLKLEAELEAKFKPRLEGISGGKDEIARIEAVIGESDSRVEISIRGYEEFSEERERELFRLLPEVLGLGYGTWKRHFTEYGGEFYWTTTREALWQGGLDVRLTIWQASKRGCVIKQVEKITKVYESICAPEVEALGDAT